MTNIIETIKHDKDTLTERVYQMLSDQLKDCLFAVALRWAGKDILVRKHCCCFDHGDWLQLTLPDSNIQISIYGYNIRDAIDLDDMTDTVINIPLDDVMSVRIDLEDTI